MQNETGMVFAGIVILFLLSIFTILKVRSEYHSLEKLSMPTVVIVWALYFLYTGLTALAAWRSLWPIPINKLFLTIAGGFLILAGIGIVMAGILEFRSLQRMSGQATDRLISSGIYQWSRNPQNVGWIMTLLGVALLRRSAGALLLVALVGLLLHVYIVYVEEGFLEDIYGQAYRNYRARTPRYLGFRKP